MNRMFYFPALRFVWLLILFLCLISGYAYSQSSNRNYIVTRTFTDSSGSSYQDRVAYFDGLGRAAQSVLRNASPGGGDIVSLQEYDNMGRESNLWSPVSMPNNSGRYVPPETLRSAAVSLYTDSNPYSKPVYELSPLNRLLEQYGPGEDWHEHSRSVKTSYLSNVFGNDTLDCVFYSAGSSVNDTVLTLTRVKSYASSELFVTRVEDEDGNASFEFKDKLGQVILTRGILGKGTSKTILDTYYVYDDLGNLVAVLPPEASDAFRTGTPSSWRSDTDATLLRYAFLYKYNSRNLPIAKKLPGCAWTFYLYDKGDRPVFSQDGNMRARGEWFFSIPDALGRDCFSGLCKNSFNVFSPLSAVVKADWQSDNSSAVGNGPYKGYYLSGVSLVSPTVLLVNYYNDYSFLGKNGIPVESDPGVSYDTDAESAGFGKRYTSSSQGLLTGMLTACLNSPGSPSYFYTVLYYDSYDRLVQSKSSNHLAGGKEREYSAYNFTGQLVKRKHVHSATGKPAQTETYSYAYDHAGRLLTTTHQLNGGSPITLASNRYDELGRLLSNSRNGNPNLTTGYAYNVRSWIKSITGPLFSESLYYNDSRSGGTNVSCYNGNISGMDWHVSNDKVRGYNFSYDNLSRLTGAAYLEDHVASSKFSTSYSYDRHGNMLRLSRHGNAGTTTYGVVDALTLSYDGNRLVSVEDGGLNPTLSMSMDFRDGSHKAVEYTYDSNGNLVKDLNKGIIGIEYNFLNLPRRVTFTGANNPSNEYVYSAGGKKLSGIHRSSIEKRTDYVDNMIYENGSLKRILVDGGYLENGIYHFYLQDHLGNQRVVSNSDGTVIQVNHYYPYGMPFAESTHPSRQPYKYNGKELDSENGLSWYDYGARHYDAALGRFVSGDPMAEKYYAVSPYVYCGNNPVMLVDVNGKEWGLVLNVNGTMTVTLSVNLKMASNLNLTSTQVSAYKTAISTQLNNTFQEVSRGRITASMSFDGGKDPNRLTPSITLNGDNDIMGLGFAFYGGVQLNVNNISDMAEFAETAVHELFHTLNLQDLAATPHISDTKLIKMDNGFVTTSTTAKNIHKNIMNYGSTKIDGKSYKEIYNSRSGMNQLTKGQLSFLLKSIMMQMEGYGQEVIQKNDETMEEYRQRYMKLFNNYWNNP